MPEKVEMGHVVVPPHHQSAPKEHWAQKDIMAAAREIDEGAWIPDPDPERDMALEGLGLALGLGTAGVAVGEKPALEEFRNTYNLDLIGRHPRVVEALEKMRQEVYAPPDPQAALERNLALRELVEQSAEPQKWDGQGRWEGYDNEQMRHGKVLAPQEFYERLTKVIGTERVLLGEYMVRSSPEARSGRIGLYVRNPRFKGQARVIEAKLIQIRELREKGTYEMKRVQSLRRLGLHSEADRGLDLAGQMAEEALRLRMEVNCDQEMAEPELLRVGTLQWPLGTEWMMMTFTEFGAVYAAKFLGWRTALLTMIRARAITEAEAHKAFPVPSGPAAAWYLEQLREMRDAEGTVQ